jgi:hypothetical protein
MMVVQQTATAQPTDPAVEDELDRLATMPIAQLRVRYGEEFRNDPPNAFVPIYCAGASRIGFRRRPTAASPVRRSACSTS